MDSRPHCGGSHQRSTSLINRVGVVYARSQKTGRTSALLDSSNVSQKTAFRMAEPATFIRGIKFFRVPLAAIADPDLNGGSGKRSSVMGSTVVCKEKQEKSSPTAPLCVSHPGKDGPRAHLRAPDGSEPGCSRSSSSHLGRWESTFELDDAVAGFMNAAFWEGSHSSLGALRRWQGTSSPCADCRGRTRPASEGKQQKRTRRTRVTDTRCCERCVCRRAQNSLHALVLRICDSACLNFCAFLKCVVCFLCPAGAQHGHEALGAPTRLRQPLSMNFTHASAQKRVRPTVSAADDLCLECCSVPNIFSVRSCTWVRVSCGCDCLHAAYQVPARTATPRH